MIDAIVRLPDKLFLTTGIPACIFILSKNRDGKDGKHRERNNEILFIDASKLGAMASRKLRVFGDHDVEKIAETYQNWRNIPLPSLEGKYEDIEGFCKAATLDEVRAQDYKLTPGIYVGTEAAEEDSEPFEEKMERLQTQLLEQFEIGNELQERIIFNFRL
jgi:type I restriction enzyme M protein